MPNNKVIALDFDGVLCDSANESSNAAFKCVKKFVPNEEILEEYAHLTDAPDQFKEQMRRFRPIIETGYENILLAKMMMLKGQCFHSKDFDFDYICENWNDEVKIKLLDAQRVDKDELIEQFGSVRDEWMNSDSDSWLNANSFYEGLGINEAVKMCQSDLYIITTKQSRFASALIKHAGFKIPDDHVYGLGSGPKKDILFDLKLRNPKSTIHFVEDRIETLESVSNDSRLDDVKLYLASWGYNTQEQRKIGRSNSRIELTSPERFKEMII